ncbi:MAG TPA: KUP/HAK/KT family potassium transporter [Polyangiales bacterium]|nr:KUP/HAK/KT family potassium transporter [Polyangiales bacterium]
MTTVMEAVDHAGHTTERSRLPSLALGALGVVFGDIGTSPLYAFKEALDGPHRVAATHDNVLGVLSLIFWALTLVVTVKYLLFIMRAHNHGEGGAFALLALLPERERRPGKLGAFVVLGVLSAALLYGDGIVTPAISVLSAVEGLELAAPSLQHAVLPITCAVLVGLFALQSRGTGHIGRLFGPVMIVWFLTIAGLGVGEIVKNPHVLRALSPYWALHFFQEHGLHGGLILGAVVLAVTGGEALYADMGHFGVRPIRLAWFVVALPALLLAYLGQGALVLRDPTTAGQPFFSMARPGFWTYALVVLASLATVVASQALISGVFSLTRQAVQLGFLPRLNILHTAWREEGQVYVPFVNWFLAAACIALVLSFKSSGALAAAYGIAVSGTMALTSIVFFEVARARWRWPLWQCLLLLVFFLSLDLPFLAANGVKLLDGGYVPVLVAAVITMVMVIWRRGQMLFTEQLHDEMVPLDEFLRTGCDKLVGRVPGTAVYFTKDADAVPSCMLKQLRSIPVLQEHVVILSLEIEKVPEVASKDCLKVERLQHGFWRVSARAGFKQQVDVPRLIGMLKAWGLPTEPESTTYYLRRETFLATNAGKMGMFPEGCFSFLARNARPIDAYFQIPPDQVFEIGAQFDL